MTNYSIQKPLSLEKEKIVKPKFLVIEIDGLEKWLDDLQNKANYEVNAGELLSFIISNFKNRQTALLNLDYSLIEIYAEQFGFDTKDMYCRFLISEYRKLGMHVLKQLDSLGCFLNDKMDYDFADLISGDSFILWKANKSDI